MDNGDPLQYYFLLSEHHITLNQMPYNQKKTWQFQQHTFVLYI